MPLTEWIVQLQPFTGTIWFPSNPGVDGSSKVMLVLLAPTGILRNVPLIVAGLAATVNAATGAVGGEVGLFRGILGSGAAIASML